MFLPPENKIKKNQNIKLNVQVDEAKFLSH